MRTPSVPPRTYLLIALQWLAPLFLAAQDVELLHGVVFASDGAPMPGVVLTLEPGQQQTLSDADGSFDFGRQSLGTYTLNATLLGHRPARQEVVLDAGSSGVEVRLDADALDLTEIRVIGKSVATSIEESGFAVEAVELAEEARGSVQVNDLLDRASGIRIRQSGGMGSRIQYNINGLSGNAIRIFIDGVPISSYGPSFSLSSIPATQIERIEVYKGVVPVELAGDALGGAINVILKKETATNHLQASYSYGSFDTHQAAASGNYYQAESGLTVRGSAFYNKSDNDYEVWGNQVYTTDPTTGDITYVRARRFHDTYRSAGANFQAGLTGRKWADELLVGAVVSTLDRDIQHGATMESVYGNRRAYQGTTQLSASFKDRDFLTENLSVELFSSYSDLGRDIVDTTAHIYDWDGYRKPRYDGQGRQTGWYEYISGAEAGNPTLQHSDESVYLSRALLKYSINDRHRLTANFLYSGFTRESQDPLRHVDIRDLEDSRFSNRAIGGISYTFTGPGERLQASAFYKYFHQWVRIVEYRKANAQAAVELNRVKRDVRADGFGFTLAYELRPNLLVTTSAERSFRLPVSRELFGNLAENLEPNYGLKPERSKNLNLGLTFGTYRFGPHEARLRINTFVRDTEDKIKRNVREDDTDETTEYVNDDSYISQGFDLDLYYSYRRNLTFTGNFSVFNSRFNTEFNDAGLAYDWYRARERNAPFLTANGNLRYRIAHLLQRDSEVTLGGNLAYVHWFYRDWETLGSTGKDIVPTQLVCDLSLVYAFPNERLAVGIDARNLFDHQVFDNYALQKPGRAFYAKLTVNLF